MQAQIHTGLPQWLSKNLPAIQETQVQSVGQEDPLEEGMVTHSSILAQRIPWTEEATMHGVAESQTQLKRHCMHARWWGADHQRG